MKYGFLLLFVRGFFFGLDAASLFFWLFITASPFVLSFIFGNIKIICWILEISVNANANLYQSS